MDYDLQILRLNEAAAYVRVTEKTLRRMARTNRVPCQRVGREWRFPKQALDEWLAGKPVSLEGTPAIAEPLGQAYLPQMKSFFEPNDRGLSDTGFTKNRQEPVHRWVPWIAGFSSAFVKDVLSRERKSRARLTVLDPFAGVGTTLIEAIRCGCDAMGFEINPYAALACQVKIEAFYRDPEEIRKLCKRFVRTLRNRVNNSAREPRSIVPPGFKTRDPFFSPEVERHVLFVKDCMAEETQPWARHLIAMALGSVLVGVSNYSYEPSLGRRISAGKPEIRYADLPSILERKLLDMAADIELLQQEMAGQDLSEAQIYSESFMETAPVRVKEGSVDVLITSPPYLNNYHYVRNTRPQMYWLDFVQESSDLTRMERKSFGKFWQTVRSNGSIPLSFSCLPIEKKLQELRTIRSERGPYGGPGWANYAATYFNDCSHFCEIAAKLMVNDGLAVVVIGNNILQGIEFKTDEFFAEIAQGYGFAIEGLHRVRKKRTGSSIIHSSVRIGTAREKVELYETAVALRKRG